MDVNLDAAFDELAAPDYWTDVALVFVGYMIGIVLKAAVEGRTGFDLPDPTYGVAVGAAGAVTGYRRVALGGGAHAVHEAAGLTGVENTVVSMAGGA